MKIEIRIHGKKHAVEFESSRAEAVLEGRTISADAAEISPGVYSILLRGRSFEVALERSGAGWLARTAEREYQIEILDPRTWQRAQRGGIELEGRQQVIAPMPGKVVRVLVGTGQKVEAGQGLLVIEAMKMQNEVRSPKTGTVERLAQEGKTVNAGEVLAVVN